MLGRKNEPSPKIGFFCGRGKGKERLKKRTTTPRLDGTGQNRITRAPMKNSNEKQRNA
jgi:hypothetical protein